MLGITIFSQAEDMVKRTKNGKTLTWCESQKIHLAKDKSLKAIKLLYVSEKNCFGLFEGMGTYNNYVVLYLFDILKAHIFIYQ